jgi:AcrR family transcriptional regulator
MAARTTCRDRILDAAQAVVLERGAGHMSLDAVAARANVSKGGVLYHFPGQRQLLDAMVQRLLDYVEARAARTAASLPAGPARELKATMLAWFTLGKEHRNLAGALLAAVTRDPAVLATIRERRRAKVAALLTRVPRPEQAKLVMLAVEGLWMSELLGIAAYPPAERAQLRRALLRLADDACIPNPASWPTGAHKPARGRRSA